MLITKLITLFLKSQRSTLTIYYGYVQYTHQANQNFLWIVCARYIMYSAMELHFFTLFPHFHTIQSFILVLITVEQHQQLYWHVNILTTSPDPSK
jgi:hypothetical protein